METSIIERKTMEWIIVKNVVQCGVFTMRHMETYKRETPWTCGFAKEGENNNRPDAQLRLLRNRYLSKIFLSEYNLQRQEIIKATKTFDKRLDRDAYLEDLDKNIEARLDLYFGRSK
ncbi:hypothetical protein Hanom_Chr05g00396091 [Helianthus anomalus]